MMNIQQFASQVKKCRDLQKNYFIAKGKAMKTRHPDDHKLAAHFLALSKAAENILDETVKNILQPEEKGVAV
jgi:hypothetical protein